MEQVNRSHSVKATSNLIALKRGADELLLVNSFHMRPLYVPRGRKRVGEILAEAALGRSENALASLFAQDEALIRMLRRHLILVDPDQDKERFDDAEIAATAAGPSLRKRMTVYLLLTESCNLGCIYCLNGAQTYHKQAASRMTPDVAFQGIEACMGQLAPDGTLEVAFFGGEPLLNWPLAKQIINHCEGMLQPRHPDKTIVYHITSNLTNCPPDLVDVVKSKRITMMGDIDGPPEIHDRCRPMRTGGPSHEPSARTIRKLVDAGIPVSLRATITSLNHDRILDIAGHHKELGAVNSAFVPVSPINSDRQYLPDALLPDPDMVMAGLSEVFRSGLWPRENLFPYNQYLLKLRPGSRQVRACAAPSGAVPVVRADGDVYPCIYLVGQDKFRIGRHGAPRDLAPLSQAMTGLHVDRLKGCRSCAWRYPCGGGCPVMKLAAWDGVEPSPRAGEYGRKITCDLIKGVLTELLWDMARDARAAAGGSYRVDDAVVAGTVYC